MFFSSDATRAGGIQEHIYNLSRTLTKRGHQVHVFGPTPNKLAYPNYVSIGQIYNIPSLMGNMSYLHVVDQSKTHALVSKINSSFDICHIHEPSLPVFLWELLNQITIPKVATWHTAWDDQSLINIVNPLLSFFKKSFSAKINGVIYVSQIARKRWGLLCEKRIPQTVISNGIDHQLFRPRQRTKSSKLRLLFMGRLVARKGLLYLLRALRKAGIQNCELKVVGDGDELVKLKHYVQSHRMSDTVKFTGEIVGERRVKFFQEADIFCAPYANEASPITPLEAMATGCPIVGFRNSAFDELLRGYPAPQLFVKSNDVPSLAHAIRKLAEDTSLRQKLRNWELTESKKYTWDKVATETESLYLRANRS